MVNDGFDFNKYVLWDLNDCELLGLKLDCISQNSIYFHNSNWKIPLICHQSFDYLNKICHKWLCHEIFSTVFLDELENEWTERVEEKSIPCIFWGEFGPLNTNCFISLHELLAENESMDFTCLPIPPLIQCSLFNQILEIANINKKEWINNSEWNTIGECVASEFLKRFPSFRLRK